MVLWLRSQSAFVGFLGLALLVLSCGRTSGTAFPLLISNIYIIKVLGDCGQVDTERHRYHVSVAPNPMIRTPSA